MNISRQLLCIVYGAIALLALLATWHQNVAYFGGRSVHRDGAVLAGDTGDARKCVDDG
jgi:hypothetical protein